MTHDVKIEKPRVGTDGLSDPVNLFDEDGKLHIAQWYEPKNCWLEIIDGEKQTYGDKGMHWWSEIQFPHGYVYDDVYYSLFPVDEEKEKAAAMLGLKRPIDIDAVMADIKKTIESV